MTHPRKTVQEGHEPEPGAPTGADPTNEGAGKGEGVYPKHTPTSLREDDLWAGYPKEMNASYGLAKKKMLLVQAQAYRPEHGFDAIYLLPVNRYGPGDNVDPEISHVIPALIRRFVEATEHCEGTEPVNLGSGEKISIRDLGGRIASIVGYQGSLARDETRPDGQPRRRLDTSRPEEASGFGAEVGLDEGLRRTVEWYLEHRADADPRRQPVLPS